MKIVNDAYADLLRRLEATEAGPCPSCRVTVGRRGTATAVAWLLDVVPDNEYLQAVNAVVDAEGRSTYERHLRPSQIAAAPVRPPGGRALADSLSYWESKGNRLCPICQTNQKDVTLAGALVLLLAWHVPVAIHDEAVAGVVQILDWASATATGLQAAHDASRRNALTVTCPTCGAVPGQRCRKALGPACVPLDQPGAVRTPHTPRLNLAAGHTVYLRGNRLWPGPVDVRSDHRLDAAPPEH